MLLETLELVTPYGRACVSPRGAQVIDAELSGVPLLWRSPLVGTMPGKPLRAGVPICFPWFGKHPQGLPAHGFARLRDWTVKARSGAMVTFELCDDQATRALWPHRFRAELTVTLDVALHFRLRVENQGEQPLTFSYALHSYLAVADSKDVRIEGLSGRLRREVGHVTTPQVGDVTLADATDAIFEHAPGPLDVHLPSTTIHIESMGMDSAIVWNPGAAGAEIGDVGAFWPRFVCAERGNVGAKALTLTQGATHEGTMSLSVQPRCTLAGCSTTL